MFFKSVLCLSLFSALAMAQVGQKELAKWVKSDYLGDTSITVTSVTDIQEVLKSWKVSQYQLRGETYPVLQNDEDSLRRFTPENRKDCSLSLNDHKNSIEIEINVEGSKQSLEFQKTETLLENLSQGLESRGALFQKVQIVDSKTRVVRSEKSQLSLSLSEGYLVVSILNENGDGTSCSVIEK